MFFLVWALIFKIATLYMELYIDRFYIFLVNSRKNVWGLKQGYSPGGICVGGHNGLQIIRNEHRKEAISGNAFLLRNNSCYMLQGC